MKLSFSSNAFTKKNILYAVDSILETGYDGIEIVLDIPHGFLPLKKSKIQNIKKKLSNDFQISNLNCNTVLGWHKSKINAEKFEPSLSNPDTKLRNWRISYTKKAIDLAAELDSPSICITSGIKPQENVELHNDLFKSSLDELSSYAEKKDIKIAIEYETGLLLENSQDVFTLAISENKNVGLNLDTCHAAVLRENIPNLISKFNKKLFHIHFSDCKNQKHYHLIPGLGEIDFKEFYNALEHINYEGFITAELYTYNKNPEKAASETFIYLKKLVS